LIVPQRFYVHAQAAHGDRHVYALRTRFIPESIVGRFEPGVWPDASSDLAAWEPECAARPAIDVAARIRAFWS
jgi:DNA helicase-2/ATP-dependent DNA helicase PcrA